MPHSQSDDRSEPRRRLPARRLYSGVPPGSAGGAAGERRHPSAGISAQPRRRRGGSSPGRRCGPRRSCGACGSVVPAVAAAPPIVVLAELAGASFRHPVTVTFLSALGVLVCGVGGCLRGDGYGRETNDRRKHSSPDSVRHIASRGHTACNGQTGLGQGRRYVDGDLLALSGLSTNTRSTAAKAPAIWRES